MKCGTMMMMVAFELDNLYVLHSNLERLHNGKI